MTSNTINYMANYEQARHNAAVEAENKRYNDAMIAQKQAELAETVRADVASEKIRRKEAKTNQSNAKSNRMNAKTNRMNANTSRAEHKTSVKTRKQNKAYQEEQVRQKDWELRIKEKEAQATQLKSEAAMYGAMTGQERLAWDKQYGMYQKKLAAARNANDKQKVLQDWYKFVASNPLAAGILTSLGVDPLTGKPTKAGRSGQWKDASSTPQNVYSSPSKKGPKAHVKVEEKGINGGQSNKTADISLNSWKEFWRDYKAAAQQSSQNQKAIKAGKAIESTIKNTAKRIWRGIQSYGEILSRTEPG